jgi:hypothetical protein
MVRKPSVPSDFSWPRRMALLRIGAARMRMACFHWRTWACRRPGAGRAGSSWKLQRWQLRRKVAAMHGQMHGHAGRNGTESGVNLIKLQFWRLDLYHTFTGDVRDGLWHFVCHIRWDWQDLNRGMLMRSE